MRFALIVLLAGLVAACGFDMPPVAPIGLSQEEAIAKATAEDPQVTGVLDAEWGRLGEFVDVQTLPTESRERLVWAITLSGQFQLECVAGGTCPPAASSKLVILDFGSGEFLMSQSPR